MCMLTSKMGQGKAALEAGGKRQQWTSGGGSSRQPPAAQFLIGFSVPRRAPALVIQQLGDALRDLGQQLRPRSNALRLLGARPRERCHDKLQRGLAEPLAAEAESW